MQIPIAIATVPGGGITVNPSSVSANPLDTIQWSLAGAQNLTISFPNKTPFSLQQLSVPDDHISQDIVPNAGATAYGYLVAAVVDGQQYVGPPPMGPEIIVMRPPT